MSPQAIDKTPHNWLQNIDAALLAQQAWRERSYNQTVFAHFQIKLQHPFVIACGAGLLAAHVRKFRFNEGVIAQMGRLVDHECKSIFDESFLNHLQRLSLRIQLQMPAEGTLLLPGEPLAIMRGSLDQVLLMQSTMQELVGRSTFFTTEAAVKRWNANDLKENDTPPAPTIFANRQGWTQRAAYIGGLSLEEAAQDHIDAHDFSKIELTPQGHFANINQIRRLFKSNLPLADVLMTQSEDQNTSVSKSDMEVKCINSGKVHAFRFTRFQNVYQPLLVKGHPVLASPQLAIRRQRTLHQMQAFHEAGLGQFVIGKEVLLNL